MRYGHNSWLKKKEKAFYQFIESFMRWFLLFVKLKYIGRKWAFSGKHAQNVCTYFEVHTRFKESNVGNVMKVYLVAKIHWHRTHNIAAFKNGSSWTNGSEYWKIYRTISPFILLDWKKFFSIFYFLKER